MENSAVGVIRNAAQMRTVGVIRSEKDFPTQQQTDNSIQYIVNPECTPSYGPTFEQILDMILIINSE